MRHGQKKSANLAAAITKGIAIGMASVLVGVAGVVGYAWWDLSNAAGSHEAVKLDSDRSKLPTFEGAFNLLVIGSDSGGGDTRFQRNGENLADVTILLHVSANRQHAEAISIPRDSLVNLPACTGPDDRYYPPVSDVRFNSSLSRGGLSCTVRAAEALTGVSIPYALMLQFDSVIRLTEIIGGVQVCLTGPVRDRYTGLDLSAGIHNLEGVQALAFLRTRHGIGDGSDLSRIRSQQGFLSSMLRKLRQINLTANPQQAYALVRTVLANTTLSTSLDSLPRLLGMVLAINKVKPTNFVFMRYPTYIYQSAARVQLDQAAKLNKALQDDLPINLEFQKGVGVQVQTPAPTATEAEPASPAETPASPAPTQAGIDVSGVGQLGDQEVCTVPFGD